MITMDKNNSSNWTRVMCTANHVIIITMPMSLHTRMSVNWSFWDINKHNTKGSEYLIWISQRNCCKRSRTNELKMFQWISYFCFLVGCFCYYVFKKLEMWEEKISMGKSLKGKVSSIMDRIFDINKNFKKVVGCCCWWMGGLFSK